MKININSILTNTIKEKGYTKLTPIQEQCIPLMLSGEDIMAQAETGTGKTAAFALPILDKANCKLNKTQALILTPTRELALQVAEAFNGYGKNLKLGATAIYGGQSYTIQKKAIQKRPQIIVATPGRLVDMIKQKNIDLSQVQYLILDEADEMLKMGFLDDVSWIIEQLPENKQVALFSATLPLKVKKMAKKYLRDPKIITIEPKTLESEQISQQLVQINKNNKLDCLYRILAQFENHGTIIFVKTKQESMEIADKLALKGHTVSAINGDINQAAREKTIERLKQARINILVATDVAARGIDVERVEHVINYDMPFDVDSYVHRIGRTGRGGRTGLATSFAANKDRSLLRDIEKKFGPLKVIQPPSSEELNRQQLISLQDKIINVANKSKKLTEFKVWSEDFIAKNDSISTEEKLAALAYLFLQNSFFDEKAIIEANNKSQARTQRYKSKSERKPKNAKPSKQSKSFKFKTKERGNSKNNYRKKTVSGS